MSNESQGKGSQGNPISPHKAKSALLVINKPFRQHNMVHEGLLGLTRAYWDDLAHLVSTGLHDHDPRPDTSDAGGRRRLRHVARGALRVPWFPFQASFEGDIGPYKGYTKPYFESILGFYVF